MTLGFADFTSLKALQAPQKGVARQQGARGPVGVACHSGRCLLFCSGRRLGRLSQARHGVSTNHVAFWTSFDNGRMIGVDSVSGNVAVISRFSAPLMFSLNTHSLRSLRAV
jgi:hypothetical protein